MDGEKLIRPEDRIIYALDNMSWSEAVGCIKEVSDYVGLGKTNSLHQRKGTDYAVAMFANNGMEAMIDAKFHDKPDTVEDEVQAVTLSGASLITVHASGGIEMLRAAIRGRDKVRNQMLQPKCRVGLIGRVLGVTVLTSLDEEDCESIFGIPADDPDGIKKKVVEFAYMVLDAGLDGIVCSPLELTAIRSNSNFDGLLTVVPGITPVFARKAEDQKRTASAREAIASGADMIVVGSAINKAVEYNMTKAQAAQALLREIKEGLGLG